MAAGAMREPAYFVLASLLGGPLHGSAIIECAEYMSDGRVRLMTGGLYTVLDRLTADGYVHRASSGTGTERRRCYVLTESGLIALRAAALRAAAPQSRAAGLVATAADGTRVGRIVSIGGRIRLGGR
jgi:PadR family transcriptional regulator PadR